MVKVFKFHFAIISCALIAACTHVQVHDGFPLHPKDVSHVPDAMPRVEAKSPYGNPPVYEVYGKQYSVMDSAKGYRATGIASWYGTKFQGRRTSSGERYDMYHMTAAHKTLPLPTYARVTNLDNGKHIVVKINDRGPFVGNRLIDLSYAGAYRLGILAKGTGRVEVVAIDPTQPAQAITYGAPPDQTFQQIYIQVGAFAEQSRAKALAAQLDNSHINAFVQPGWQQSTPVYRVQIGPLNNTDQADKLRERLVQLTHSTPIMIMQ